MYIEASVPPTVDQHATTCNLEYRTFRQAWILISFPCSVSLCFPCIVSLCFPFASAIPISVRISDSDLHSGPRFQLPFHFPFRIPFRFPFHFPFRIPFHLPFCFPFRFPFRIPSRFSFRFTYRILFHDPRFSTGNRSGSCSGFRFRLAFLPAAPPAASRFAPARRCFIQKAALDHGQSLG